VIVKGGSSDESAQVVFGDAAVLNSEYQNKLDDNGGSVNRNS